MFGWKRIAKSLIPFGICSAISGCVTTAPTPELRLVTCPSTRPEHTCDIPTRESENPIPEMVLALACLQDHFEYFQDEWEDCDS